MSFTGEAAIAAASVALLIHARPLWIGLEDEGFVGTSLAAGSGASAGAWFVPGPPSGTERAASRGWVSGVLGILCLGVLLFVMKATLLHHLFPSGSAHTPVVSAPGEAIAWRRQNGSFFIEAQVNDQYVPMMFDTGASMVALRAEDAVRVGIAMDKLSYSIQVRTANGLAYVAPVTIDTMTVGAITMRDVRAVVAKPGVLHENLLGQTFLVRLRDYQVEGSRVVFHGG